MTCVAIDWSGAKKPAGKIWIAEAKAIGSEDAFDAAVSALVMDTHCEQFPSLRSGDPLSRIEGEIWAP